MGLLILSDREVTLESGAAGGQHQRHVHGAVGAVPAAGDALRRWLLHLRAALDSSDLTAAPFPSSLSSSSLAASASDKVTASEAWKPWPDLLPVYSCSSPLCRKTGPRQAKPTTVGPVTS